MRIAILQLARLGDILQTLPTLEGLKKIYPDAEITLVVRSTFSDAAKLSPHVDKLVEFPAKDVLGPCLADRVSGRQASLDRLAAWISGELSGKYDLLLNLTFSKASSYLASLIDAKERRGMARGRDGSLSVDDPWSTYFISQVLTRNLNIIHLNDLFAWIAGLDAAAFPTQLKEPNCKPLPRGPKTKVRIGIQISASAPEKSLNRETWACVCRAIIEKIPLAELVFFGGANDVPGIVAVLSEVERRMAGRWQPSRCTVVAGSRKFHENLSIVRDCDWIVAPDTAIVHLASLAKGRAESPRIIEIAVGDVRPEDTGPYGDGHHVLYPVSCDKEGLAEEITQLLRGKNVGKTVALSRSKMMARSDGTFRSVLAPDNFTDEETSSFFKWSYYLLAEFRCAGRVEDVPIPRLGDPVSLEKLLSAFDALCAILRLAEFGQHYCMKMLEELGNPRQLKLLSEKIAEIETMLLSLQKTVSFVRPLIDTWTVAKDVARSPQGVEEVVALTEGTYRELKQNCEIIQQLLESAVQQARKNLGHHKDARPAKSEPSAKERVDT